jgi:MerR family mercuric resistance operon transcriptional regulator
MVMTIGQLADAASVNIQTVRYYERRGLVPEPARTPAGYRQYSEDAVARIRFIRRAKELGFSLKEIDGLLDLRVHHETACHDVEAKAREKIALVDQKIRELRAMQTVLEELVTACATNAPTTECPIIETLERTEAG